MEIKDKKILIFGLARSGAGAANLLAHLGADITVTDKRPAEDLGEYISRLSPDVKLCLGGYPSRMNGTDMIVVSPGVPLDIAPLSMAREKGIKIAGELEIAYLVISSQLPGISRKPEFLAVTGTNGKSTTTALLDAMLRKAGLRTLLGGNIGNALTEEILKVFLGDKAKNRGQDIPDFIVAEISSFQLESTEEFSPKGAAILNITPDHMDRYPSIEEYKEAKARIFMKAGRDDYIVLNADDPETMLVYSEKSRDRGSEFPSVFFFSRKKKVRGIYMQEGIIYSDLSAAGSGNTASRLMSADAVRIKGDHNLENAMAAAAMALLAGCSPEAVTGALREFPGLEHRMEFVRELHGVRYINDSKGTNVGAVVKSVGGFSGQIILIAGGRDKDGDFSQLRPVVSEKVKMLILIGEAAEKIRDALGGLTKTVFAGGLNEAVNIASDAAASGDVILLSPACASFDMFRDFEDRGRQFKDIVMGLS